MSCGLPMVDGVATANDCGCRGRCGDDGQQHTCCPLPRSLFVIDDSESDDRLVHDQLWTLAWELISTEALGQLGTYEGCIKWPNLQHPHSVTTSLKMRATVNSIWKDNSQPTTTKQTYTILHINSSFPFGVASRHALVRDDPLTWVTAIRGFDGMYTLISHLGW